MAPPCRHCGKPHEAYVTMCPVTGGRLGSAAYTIVNDDEALIGTVIAERYHVRELLGQGSTGTVFGTMHMHFDRPAAMKVLRPRYTLLDTVQRVFHTETRAAFSVLHPSLCEVFDIGTLPSGAPFFVMERLEGDTLAARLGRERFSTAAAVDLLMQLLSAMEAVHARDLLVRDLRPQNIFLAHRRGCRPVLKILDLGLSRLIPLERVQDEWDALRTVVNANDSSGSLSIPYYLSPERTRGDQGIEPTSDLFVAAVIFYEALTGVKPFVASTFNGILLAIAQARPRPLAELRPDVPEELSSLIMRALSGNPRGRPASAREMQDELRAVFEGTKRGGSTSLRASPPTSITEAGYQPAPPPSPRVPQVPPPVARALVSQAQAAPVTREHPGDHADSLTPFAGLPPSDARATDRPTALVKVDPDLFEDQTNVNLDRRHIEVTLARRVDAALQAESAASVTGVVIDEASAEHPIRTTRPAAGRADEIDVDIDMDAVPATSRGSELGATLALSSSRASFAQTLVVPTHEEPEDETETMQLTPEVRARIEEMTRNAVAAGLTEPDPSGPPETRRLTKPPK